MTQVFLNIRYEQKEKRVQQVQLLKAYALSLQVVSVVQLALNPAMPFSWEKGLMSDEAASTCYMELLNFILLGRAKHLQWTW